MGAVVPDAERRCEHGQIPGSDRFAPLPEEVPPVGPVRPPARSPASGQSSRRVRTRRDAPYSGGKKRRAFIDAVGIRENGPPVPSVSLDSIRAAVTAKAHPKLRAAAAKVSTGGVVPRRTRATAATVDASATTMASSAQRTETLAEDREPRADKIRAAAQAAAKEAAAKENKTAARAAAKAKGHKKRKRRASTPEPDPQLAQAWSENGPRLSFEMLKHDEKTREMCTNLTGMPSADVCVKFYELLNVNRRAENLVLYDYRGDGNASGRGEGEEPKRAREGRRAIKAPDAYLMTLVMLHKGLDQKFTGWLFGVHQNTLAPYFITWLQFLKQYLSELMPFRPRLRHRLKIRLKIRLRIQRLPPGGAHGGKQLTFQRKKSQRTISGRASWLSRPRTVLAKRCGEIQMILTVVLINDRPTFMFYSSMLLYSCRLSEMRSK